MARNGTLTKPAAIDADSVISGVKYVVTQAPANGSLTFGTNGTFTYTPTAKCTGIDVFKYYANDGNWSRSPNPSMSADSQVITVTVTVTSNGR